MPELFKGINNLKSMHYPESRKPKGRHQLKNLQECSDLILKHDKILQKQDRTFFAGITAILGVNPRFKDHEHHENVEQIHGGAIEVTYCIL